MLWLVVSTALFAGLYLDAHRDRVNDAAPAAGQYAHQPAASAEPDGPPAPGCVAGPGTPERAAFQLSLRKTLLLPGIAGGDKLKEIYACLYGVDSPREQPPGRLLPPFRPIIPDGVAALGLIQVLFSAVLLFLLLLAIRNHFRIK